MILLLSRMSNFKGKCMQSISINDVSTSTSAKSPTDLETIVTKRRKHLCVNQQAKMN